MSSRSKKWWPISIHRDKQRRVPGVSPDHLDGAGTRGLSCACIEPVDDAGVKDGPLFSTIKATPTTITTSTTRHKATMPRPLVFLTDATAPA